MQLNNDTFATSSIVIPGPPPSYLPTGGVTMPSLYNNFMGAYPVDAAMAAPVPRRRHLHASELDVRARGADRNEHDRIRDPDAAVVRARSLVEQHDGHDDQQLHDAHLLGESAQPSPDRGSRGNAEPDASTGARFRPTRSARRSDSDDNIGNAIVGHYTQTPSQLESQFLDLQTIAEDLYTAEIPCGTVLDFTTLMDKHGQQLPGRRLGRDLAGRPHLLGLPQPGAVLPDDPRAGRPALRDEVATAAGQAPRP